MLDYAFVSYSAIDSEAVGIILSNAPKIAFKSFAFDFAEGARLVEEMKKHVRACKTFVLMCSKASLSSVWCQFEVDLAELETIKRGLSVFVIPVESGIRVRDLPEWMQDYWHPVGSARLSVLQRRFLDIIDTEVFGRSYFGLQTRVEHARRVILGQTTRTKIYPNVYFLTGLDGVGRFTTARQLIRAQFSGCYYFLGPDLYLGDPASLESLYIRLQEDVSGPLGGNFEAELLAFRSMSVKERVAKTVSVAEKISKEDETIYIRCKSGLVGSDGLLMDWAREFLQSCSQKQRLRLVVISNRQIREADLSHNQSIVHVHIKDLDNDDVIALVQETTLALSGEALSPTPQALIAIGGHPGLAQHYSAALVRYGAAAEKEAWYATVYQQRRMLVDFLNRDALSADEQMLLSLLSWFPSVKASLMEAVCVKLGLAAPDSTIRDLISESLINYHAGRYAISGPVRLVFRQLYSVDQDNVVNAIRTVLNDLLPAEKALTADAVDSIAFLFNICGTALPPQLRPLVSAASLLESARELYREGREKPGDAEYNRCIALCDAALQVTNEENLKQEIMIVQARTYLRLKKFDVADAIIKKVEKTPSRATRVARAQFFRFKGEYEKAAPIYSAVIDSGLNDDAVIHEYCICLREIGNFERVSEILSKFTRRVERNVYLLDMRSSLEIGVGDFRSAEQTLRLMKSLPDRNFAAARKEAILICKETQNYSRALALVNQAITAAAGNRHSLGDLHATKCIILSKMSLAQEAQDAFALAKSTHRQADFIAARLSIYVQLAAENNEEALALYEALPQKTRLDRALKREILRKLADDHSILDFKRISYAEQSRESNVERASFTEFDLR